MLALYLSLSLSLSRSIFLHTRIVQDEPSSQATIEIYLQYMYFYLASCAMCVLHLTYINVCIVCSLTRVRVCVSFVNYFAG